MSEQIQVEITAEDRLSSVVKKMTDYLVEMMEAQEDTTKATEDATKATEEQGKTISRFNRLLEALGHRYEKINSGIESIKSAQEGFKAKLETVFYVVELTKTASEALGGVYESLTGQVEKATTAWDEQSKKLGYAASGLGSIAETSAKVQKAQDGLYGALGRVIDRSSILQTSNLLQEKILKRLTKEVKDNEDRWADWLKNFTNDRLGDLIKFGVFVEENASSLARLNLGLSASVQLVGFVIKSFVLIGKTIYTAVTEPIADASESIRDFLSVAAFLTKDAKLSASLLNTAASLDKIRTAAKAAQIEGIVEIRESVNGLTGDAINLTTTLQNVFANDAGIKGYIDRVKDAGKLIQEIGKEGQSLLEQGSGRGKKRGDVEDTRELDLGLTDQGKLWAESIQIAKEKVIEARRQEHDLEMQRRKEIQDWEDQEQAKIKERYDLTIARIKSREAAEIESIQHVSQVISEVFANVPNLIEGVSESTQRMWGGFSQASLKIGELTKNLRAYNAINATARQQQDAINASIGAGAGILSSVTAALVEDKKTQAGIEALINAAAAAASYASGNVPGGIAYTAAAVTYGAAAAFGGGGSVSVPTGGGSASSGYLGPSTSIPDPAVERRLTAEAIAEAMGQNQNTGGTIINVDFGSSVRLQDAPQIADEIANALAPILERRR